MVKTNSKEELLSALEQNSSLMLASLDKDFNYTFASLGYAAAHGKSIDHFVKKNHFDLFPNKMMFKVFQNVLSSGQPFVLEAQPFQLDDTTSSQSRWNWEINPFLSEEDPLLILAIIDVTYEIRFREKEIQGDNRYKKLFERNLSGFYQGSMDGTIVNCNNAYARIMGCQNKEALIGKNIHDFFTMDKDAAITRWSNLVNDKLETRETNFSLLNGQEKWVLENAVLLKAESFKASLIEGSLIDITASKLAANELSKKQKEILDLQAKMLTSQMNPHFIFNAINSINSYILNEEMTNALRFTSDFASLMRKVLENSMHPFISLSSEIIFLKEYLSLERRRLRESFEFSIGISSGLESEEIKIPVMLVQPFVENAVIHGVSANPESGRIHVFIEQIDYKTICCTVEDNGPGIQKKMNSNGSGIKRSLGISIATNRIQLFNQEDNEKKYQVATDSFKNSEGRVLGTRVILLLPIR